LSRCAGSGAALCLHELGSGAQHIVAARQSARPQRTGAMMASGSPLCARPPPAVRDALLEPQRQARRAWLPAPAGSCLAGRPMITVAAATDAGRQRGTALATDDNVCCRSSRRIRPQDTQHAPRARAEMPPQIGARVSPRRAASTSSVLRKRLRTPALSGILGAGAIDPDLNASLKRSIAVPTALSGYRIAGRHQPLG